MTVDTRQACGTKSITIITLLVIAKFLMQGVINKLCHTTAPTPMPIHLYVLIAFGMGLVVHHRVDRAHNLVILIKKPRHFD